MYIKIEHLFKITGASEFIHVILITYFIEKKEKMYVDLFYFILFLTEFFKNDSILNK